MSLAVTSITPANGASAGADLVRIVGTGFADQVRVEFGGSAAALASAWTISGISYADVRTPPHDQGVVDVVLRNVDDDGDPVPGQSVTVDDGYEFCAARLARTADSAETNESGLVLVLRTLIRALKRGIVENAGPPSSVDYDETTADGLNIVFMVNLPSVVITGVRLSRRRDDASNVPSEEVVDGEIVMRAPPDYHDMEFSLTGAAEGAFQTLNLANAVVALFQRTPWLVLPTTPEVRLEMDLTGDTRVQLRSPAAGRGGDVKAFVLTAVVRGVDLGDELAVERTRAVESYTVGEDAIAAEA